MLTFLKRLYEWVMYWYYRYTVVTELYMVEKWEKYTIHFLFSLLFLMCWYFNYMVVLTMVSKLAGSFGTNYWDNMKTVAISS